MRAAGGAMDTRRRTPPPRRLVYVSVRPRLTRSLSPRVRAGAGGGQATCEDAQARFDAERLARVGAAGRVAPHRSRARQGAPV
eukprot:2537175-Prymnesium_polylepis.3